MLNTSLLGKSVASGCTSIENSTDPFGDGSLTHKITFNADKTTSLVGSNWTANGGTSVTTGKFGNAVLLDGVNGTYMSGGNAPLGSIFTISIWVKPSGAIALDVFMAGNSDSFFCWQNDNGTLYIDTNYRYTTSIGSLLYDALWHNIIIEYNSGVTKLWIDNIEKTLTQGAVDVLPTSITTLGNRENGLNYGFAGAIDQFEVYDRVLSLRERTAVYAQEICA